MTDLYQRSIDIILSNQAPTGAYVACPNFPTYHYCWFRDGAFSAYAMDRVGEYTSAARFHGWAAAAINARGHVVERATARAYNREPLGKADILHTRYTVDGGDDTGKEEWPNFQLDGFGTWLWALREHQQLSGADLPDDWRSAARLAADYVAALWPRPCYDCWEEFSDRVHPHTLAAVYGGLRAHAELDHADHTASLQAIQRFLFEAAVQEGHFVKFIGSGDVDSSLLGLAVPYGVVALDDPRMRATIEQLERELQRGGGLHRYATDTYYGGGEWVLLTAWLGWYYVQMGEHRKAEAALRWVEAQADPEGQFPEQVPVSLNDPAYLKPWQERWGEIASPLLWSHAKYIILRSAWQERPQIP